MKYATPMKIKLHYFISLQGDKIKICQLIIFWRVNAGKLTKICILSILRTVSPNLKLDLGLSMPIV